MTVFCLILAANLGRLVHWVFAYQYHVSKPGTLEHTHRSGLRIDDCLHKLRFYHTVRHARATITTTVYDTVATSCKKWSGQIFSDSFCASITLRVHGASCIHALGTKNMPSFLLLLIWDPHCCHQPPLHHGRQDVTESDHADGDHGRSCLHTGVHGCGHGCSPHHTDVGIGLQTSLSRLLLALLVTSGSTASGHPRHSEWHHMSICRLHIFASSMAWTRCRCRQLPAMREKREKHGRYMMTLGVQCLK